MEHCKACGRPLCDGETIVIVTEATLFNYGEVDYGDTERYHVDCIKIEY